MFNIRYNIAFNIWLNIGLNIELDELGEVMGKELPPKTENNTFLGTILILIFLGPNSMSKW